MLKTMPSSIAQKNCRLSSAFTLLDGAGIVAPARPDNQRMQREHARRQFRAVEAEQPRIFQRRRLGVDLHHHAAGRVGPGDDHLAARAARSAGSGTPGSRDRSRSDIRIAAFVRTRPSRNMLGSEVMALVPAEPPTSGHMPERVAERAGDRLLAHREAVVDQHREGVRSSRAAGLQRLVLEPAAPARRLNRRRSRSSTAARTAAATATKCCDGEADRRRWCRDDGRTASARPRWCSRRSGCSRRIRRPPRRSRRSWNCGEQNSRTSSLSSWAIASRLKTL